MTQGPQASASKNGDPWQKLHQGDAMVAKPTQSCQQADPESQCSDGLATTDVGYSRGGRGSSAASWSRTAIPWVCHWTKTGECKGQPSCQSKDTTCAGSTGASRSETMRNKLEEQVNSWWLATLLRHILNTVEIAHSCILWQFWPGVDKTTRLSPSWRTMEEHPMDKLTLHRYKPLETTTENMWVKYGKTSS